MKNIYSNIFSFNKKNLNKIISILNKGDIVGLPTETVYGLGGNAYSKMAVNKIFKLKKRPKFNPLIVHYYNLKNAKRDVEMNDVFYKLYRKFCPGPITFILNKKKQSKIQSLVNANLKTVAIRFPSHNFTRSILSCIKFPLAMPSANLFSSISPTSADDVADEFKKKLKLILNGGKAKIGIESTVVDLTGKPKIIRPGIINLKSLEKIIKKKINLSKNVKEKIVYPGMAKKHYSPGIPMLLNKKTANQNVAFIVLGSKFKNRQNHFNLSKKSNLLEAASNLYKFFRQIKNRGYKKIHVVKIPNKGPGIAINDRLKKASK